MNELFFSISACDVSSLWTGSQFFHVKEVEESCYAIALETQRLSEWRSFVPATTLSGLSTITVRTPFEGWDLVICITPAWLATTAVQRATTFEYRLFRRAACESRALTGREKCISYQFHRL